MFTLLQHQGQETLQVGKSYILLQLAIVQLEQVKALMRTISRFSFHQTRVLTKRVHSHVAEKRALLMERKQCFQLTSLAIFVLYNGNGQLNSDKCTFVLILKFLIKRLKNVLENVKMEVFVKMVNVNAENPTLDHIVNIKMLMHHQFSIISLFLLCYLLLLLHFSMEHITS